MAIDPDLQKLAQELAADPNTPAWEDAADLSRLHAQSFATKAAGGFEISPRVVRSDSAATASTATPSACPRPESS